MLTASPPTSTVPQKPRCHDRLLGYCLNVVIYRNLSPAINLTIRGAEIISSRP